MEFITILLFMKDRLGDHVLLKDLIRDSVPFILDRVGDVHLETALENIRINMKLTTDPKSETYKAIGHLEIAYNHYFEIRKQGLGRTTGEFLTRALLPIIGEFIARANHGERVNLICRANEKSILIMILISLMYKELGQEKILNLVCVERLREDFLVYCYGSLIENRGLFISLRSKTLEDEERVFGEIYELIFNREWISSGVGDWRRFIKSMKKSHPKYFVPFSRSKMEKLKLDV